MSGVEREDEDDGGPAMSGCALGDSSGVVAFDSAQLLSTALVCFQQRSFMF